MSKARKIKEAIVDEIAKKIQDSKSFIVAEYAGLTVSDIYDLRNKLRENDIEMKVYKNRLVKLAVKKLNLQGFDSELIGPNTFIFGYGDDISPSKILVDFAKDKESLKVKVGTFEGKTIDKDGILEIASLPSMEEALTKLASSLMAPLKNMSISLNLLVEEGHIK